MGNHARMSTEYDRLLATLARNLRRLRERQRVSQEALALEAGIDRTFISKIERRLANPSLATLCAIASVLEVSTLALLSPTN